MMPAQDRPAAREPRPGPLAPEASQGLLDAIVEASRLAASETEKTRTSDLIRELAAEVHQGTVGLDRDLATSIDARVAELDQMLSDQLNAILHHPDFQRLEASWRGLKELVTQSETGPMLRIKVLNASRQDLLKDFRAAPDYDQSALFRAVYEEEYGTFGGAPYAALVGDFEFGRGPEDFRLLEELSHVAAAAHAPFIAAAGPGLFGLDTFAELGRPRNLAKLFETVDYAKWKSFRESEDARYVGLVVPRTLGRLPYGPQTVPAEAFDFREDVDGSDHGKYLWTNAAYAYAARLTRAFAEYGWLAAIRGVEGGGLVEDLPTHCFRTDDGEIALKCPTEVAVTDRNEKLLSDLGFIAPGALQEHRLRRLLQRPVGAEAQDLPDRSRQRQRAAFHPTAVHLRGLPHRPLPQGDHAGQDRQFRLPPRGAGPPEHLAGPVRAAGRLRLPGGQVQVPPPGGPRGSGRRARASPASTGRRRSSARISSWTS